MIDLAFVLAIVSVFKNTPSLTSWLQPTDNLDRLRKLQHRTWFQNRIPIQFLQEKKKTEEKRAHGLKIDTLLLYEKSLDDIKKNMKLFL